MLMLGSGLTMVDLAISADRPDRTCTCLPHGRDAAAPRPADDSPGPAAARRHPDPGARHAAVHPRPPTWRDRRDHGRLAGRDRRAAPGDLPAVARAVGGRQATLHRRGRPHLGRPPAPDGAGDVPRSTPSPRRAGSSATAAPSPPCAPPGRPPRQPGRRHHPARGRGRQLHRAGGLDRCRPAADAAGPDRPGPTRPGGPGHRHHRRRPHRRHAARQAPFLAVGSLRRGNLWESTAMPEIREQAYDVARRGRSMHGESRRRPVDPYGLTLSTSRTLPSATTRPRPPAATPRRCGGRSRRRGRRGRGLRAGPRRPRAARPRVGRQRPLARLARAAHRAAAERHLDDRESLVPRRRHHPAPHRRVHGRRRPAPPRTPLPPRRARGQRRGADRRLRRAHQRPQTAELVESLGRSYGDDWWYAGQLAFVRQDQERWAEAEDLSSYALSVEPASGHAVHARAHVYYETGDHTAGLAWLDEWIRTRGPEANHRSHFSWHAALHELMQDDVEAVRRRYHRELSPSVVSGSRVVVDSGALLWRGRVTGVWTDDLPSARSAPRRRPSGSPRRRRRSPPCTAPSCSPPTATPPPSPTSPTRPRAARTASSATWSRPCARASSRWSRSAGTPRRPP